MPPIRRPLGVGYTRTRMLATELPNSSAYQVPAAVAIGSAPRDPARAQVDVVAGLVVPARAVGVRGCEHARHAAWLICTAGVHVVPGESAARPASRRDVRLPRPATSPSSLRPTGGLFGALSPLPRVRVGLRERVGGLCRQRHVCPEAFHLRSDCGLARHLRAPLLCSGPGRRRSHHQPNLQCASDVLGNASPFPHPFSLH